MFKMGWDEVRVIVTRLWDPGELAAACDAAGEAVGSGWRIWRPP